MSRILLFAIVSQALAGASFGTPAAARPGEGVCPDSPAEFAVVRDIGADLTLTLDGGRVVSLAGIEPPRSTEAMPDRADALRARLLGLLRGEPVGLVLLAPPGRWGSSPAFVFVGDGTLAETLLARGDLRMRPDPIARACRSALLAAEASARASKIGVWRDEALSPLDAGGDLPRAAVEGMAIVEGTVASVGETPTRLYLNLGRPRGGFAISLAKRDIALMQSDAVARARVKGARVRVRGLIDHVVGWRVDISDADAIELLPPVATDATAGAL